MRFEGRSLGAASRAFVDHFNSLLHRTITQQPLSTNITPAAQQASIRFRERAGVTGTRLSTGYGIISLDLAQICDSIVDDAGTHTLRTLSYRYTITPDGQDEPLLRWEYVRFPGEDQAYCRHHFQGPIQVTIGNDQSISLNDWHLPSGPVAIEDVLRFCINDLGVQPLSEDWDALLRESADGFYEE